MPSPYFPRSGGGRTRAPQTPHVHGGVWWGAGALPQIIVSVWFLGSYYCFLYSCFGALLVSDKRDLLECSVS